MCDCSLHRNAIVLANLFQRRLIRIKAIQGFYAFYTNREANRLCAFNQVDTFFAPRVWDQITLDQREEHRKEASNLLAVAIRQQQLPDLPVRSRSIVTKAFQGYQKAQRRDLAQLHDLLHQSVTSIERACLCVGQLLLEWMNMPDAPAYLSHNTILQRFRENKIFSKRMQQQGIGWEAYPNLVQGWYREVLQNKSIVTYLSTHAIPDHREIVDLLVKFIFTHRVIQDFFDQQDLYWSTHQHLIRREVCKVLWNKHLQCTTEKCLFHVPEEYAFYQTLVQKTLQQQEAIESLIVRAVQNWSFDRVLWIDRIIIQLATCEMQYVDAIPMRVSMDEYITLAKLYSTPHSGSFVNGVLDAIARSLSLHNS